MKNIDLRYIVKSIGSLSGIPIRLFDGEELTYTHAAVRLPRDPMEVYWEEIFAIRDHVGYYVTPLFHYYGVVNAGTVKIVVGPTSQIMANDQKLRELAFRADVPKEDVTVFVEGMNGIVRMPIESLLQMLCTVNYILNDGEKLELADVTIHDSEQTALKAAVEQSRTARVYEDDEPPSETHNTLAIEETMMGIVSKGDTAALRRWIAAMPALRGGTIAADQLRQIKNMFIVSATLVSRAAIRGGLPQDDAFTLSDAYIQRMEYLDSPSKITNLQFNMVVEFTERVEKIRHGANPSKLAIDVANYVQRHLSEPISAEDMAKELFMSRPYLSAKFKRETGETLTDFILNEKTEEAKRLLRYSDKSAAAIGAYLGFSSTSHFAKVFKKYAGLTPGEYREKHAV